MTNNEKKHFLVDNLIKIMNDSELNKIQFAEKIGFPEAKWNKIANGKQGLSVAELSNIAENLQMSEVDIYTYPKKFSEQGKESDIIKAQLTVELKQELKDKVLQLVFGNKNIEILKE